MFGEADMVIDTWVGLTKGFHAPPSFGSVVE